MWLCVYVWVGEMCVVARVCVGGLMCMFVRVCVGGLCVGVGGWWVGKFVSMCVCNCVSGCNALLCALAFLFLKPSTAPDPAKNTHIHTQVCTHTSMHKNKTCTHTRTYTYTRTHTHVCTHTHIHTNTHVNVYAGSPGYAVHEQPSTQHPSSSHTATQQQQQQHHQQQQQQIPPGNQSVASTPLHTYQRVDTSGVCVCALCLCV